MRKLACIILAILLAFGSVMALPAYAIESSKDTTESDFAVSHPISVKIETPKDQYRTVETANFTVIIKNESDKTVENISSECTFDDIQPLKTSEEVCIDDVSLKPNEQIEYSFNATIKTNRVGFWAKIYLFFKVLFCGLKEIPSIDFDDDRNIIETNMAVKFGSISISDKVKTYYKYNVEEINTNDDVEFFGEISKLTNETLSSSSFNEQEAKKNDYYAGRIIVKSEVIDDLNLKQFSADTIVYNDDCAVMQFSNDKLASQCADALNENSDVEYAEPDVFLTTQEFEIATVATTSSDNDYTWGEEYVFADTYSKYLEANQFFNLMTVAVIDTGADLDHPFLKNKILSSGYNFVGFNSNPEDDNGHGTHVAGIIADCTNNLNVRIMPVKTMNSKGQGYSEIVAQGILYAANNGANVINLSISGAKSILIDEAIDYATEKGVVVCAAAGNGDENNQPVNTENLSPSGNKNAIVVSAIDKNGKIASFSNYGDSVDVSAPGVSISSTYINGDYATMSGTSMATPHIAAVAAMFKLAHPGYSPSEIEGLITDYCEDLGEAGRDNYYGYGKVNMYNAIPDCTIKFNSNGGSSVNDEKTKSSLDFILPTPTKSFTVTLNANGGSISTSKYYKNCTLEGWYKNSSLSGVRYAPGNEYMAKTNEILYAKWTNPALGSINNPTRNHYNFVGWYTAASGGSKYTATSTINNNITLYAHWEARMVYIDNFAGWQDTNAQRYLTDRKLNVNIVRNYNNNYAPGTVYSQSVNAGNSVIEGTTITLYVSSGSKPIAVGDYVIYNGGETLYRTIAGGPKNGVYKAEASGGYVDGVYVYNGITYYQFRYAGNSSPFGWGPYWAFSQAS